MGTHILAPFVVRLKDQTEEFKDRSERSVRLWEQSLRYLMGLDNERLSHMAINAWRICEYRFVKTTIHGMKGQFERLGVMYGPGHGDPVVMMPETWPDKFLEDPIMGMGGVTYAASQINDYWHGHEVKTWLHRAYAMEVELYNTLRGQGVDLDLNDYQTRTVASYPRGWESIPEPYRYDYRPVSRLGWDIPDPSIHEFGDALGIKTPVEAEGGM